MPEINHDNVKPLVEKAEQSGSSMSCLFKCPASGATVEASAPIQKGRGVADVATASAKRSLMYSVRRSVLGAVRSVLGTGMFGRIGRDVASQVLGDAQRKASQSFSEEEKNAAIVQAFSNVSTQFCWDGKAGRWISARAAGDGLTDFAKLLSDKPVAEKYDRGVLARMLVEIANADGHLAEEEKAFLSGFITPDLGTVDELSAKPKLSSAELQETQGGVRDTLLMLAWAVALTDEELDASEQARIAELGAGLGIGEPRGAELKAFAQLHIVDQALDSLYAGGATAEAKAQVMALAQNIGLAADSAERAEIKFRKRNGLV